MRKLGLLLSAMMLAAPAAAQDSPDACADAVGTWLLAAANAAGDAVTRSLFVLTAGGEAEFVDSGQRGLDGYAPFSDAVGRWVCRSEPGEESRFRAVLLDFTFPDDGRQQIGRLDIDGTFDADDGVLTLVSLLSFFPLDGDPLGGPAEGAEPFTVTGQRITAE